MEWETELVLQHKDNSNKGFLTWTVNSISLPTDAAWTVDYETHSFFFAVVLWNWKAIVRKIDSNVFNGGHFLPVDGSSQLCQTIRPDWTASPTSNNITEAYEIAVLLLISNDDEGGFPLNTSTLRNSVSGTLHLCRTGVRLRSFFAISLSKVYCW